jgi:hypothetical protein
VDNAYYKQSAFRPQESTAVPKAVRHVGKVRGGGLQPHLIEASDGHLYVTKFQNNPQHIRILASEMLATRIALWLNLPMAQVSAISVSESLIVSSPSLRIKSEGAYVPCTTGLHFASRCVANPDKNIDFDDLHRSDLWRVRNLHEFSQVLVFDKWAGNCDGRQAIATQSTVSDNRYDVTFIDQHYCFNGAAWNFPDLRHGGLCAKMCVYRNVVGWDSFEPTLTRVEHVDYADLWKLTTGIPGEWYENDQDALCRLVEALHKRRSKIRSLIRALRDSRFRPFCRWTIRSSCER